MKKIIKHWKALIVAAVIAAIIPVTIFAAGGNTNTVQYNAVNKHINGTYAEPTMEGKQFKGWATTKEKADAGTVDFTNDPEDITNNSLNSIKNGEQKQVYAVWEDPIKYAVQLYGIGQDVDEKNNTMGLTFGPALGNDYRKTYKSHTPTDNDTIGNPHRCIHNDDWDTIIYWNNIDPYVYEQCIDQNCTHSVCLNVKKEQVGLLFNENYATYAGYTMNGDGPGALTRELVDDKRYWITKTDSNTYNYAESRVRAVLNGHDSETKTEYAGKDSDKLNDNTCLLASFPKNLQEAIGKKEVRYAPDFKTHHSYNIVYDKLWLLSWSEIHTYPKREAYNTSYDNDYYTDSRQKYKKNLFDQAMFGFAWGNSVKCYSFDSRYSSNTGYYASNYWLRTPYQYTDQTDFIDQANIMVVINSGAYCTSKPWEYYGISPGFALTTSYKFS